MRDTIKHPSNEKSLVKIGDRVLINDIEWRVAEINNATSTLYREGVGGNSHTIHKSLEEVENIIMEQREY
jgi:hypothetical protein